MTLISLPIKLRSPEATELVLETFGRKRRSRGSDGWRRRPGLVTGAAARRRAAASSYWLRHGGELEREGGGKRVHEHQRLTLSTEVRSVRPEGARRRRISSRRRRPEVEKKGRWR
jgi:hypothetical protein